MLGPIRVGAFREQCALLLLSDIGRRLDRITWALVAVGAVVLLIVGKVYL